MKYFFYLSFLFPLVLPSSELDVMGNFLSSKHSIIHKQYTVSENEQKFFYLGKLEAYRECLEFLNEINKN